MQLVVTTNKGTCSHFKSLNDELLLSSHRVKTSKTKNLSFKKVCVVEIRGKFHKTKSVVDEDVISCMADQFKEQYSQIDDQCSRQVSSSSQFHKTLHIYAHDGTFGLLFGGVVSESVSKACIRAYQLIHVLKPYLISHPECVTIKLHVCFSGCDYGSTVKSYGQQLSEEIEMLMAQSIISQRRVKVESANGWSILGFNISTQHEIVTGKEYWSHYVLPRIPELRNICNTVKDFDPLIKTHALDKLQGKPVHIASINFQN